jgi:hypothetical protein
MVDHAVDQEAMFVRIDVGRFVTVRDHEMQGSGSDDSDRILRGCPETEVAMVTSGSGIV